MPLHQDLIAKLCAAAEAADGHTAFAFGEVQHIVFRQRVHQGGGCGGVYQPCSIGGCGQRRVACGIGLSHLHHATGISAFGQGEAAVRASGP